MYRKFYSLIFLVLLLLLFSSVVSAASSYPPLSSAPCINGSADVGALSFPCENVDLISFLPLADIGGGNANDIWGWTDPLTGKEYAILGRTNGSSFIDISNPSRPIYLGNLPTHTGESIWRDIKTYKNFALIVSDYNDEHGLQLFDLTQLRTVTISTTFSETAHYGEFGSVHNIAVDEETGFAYATGGGGACSGGLHVVDIQDPLNPTFAGCFSDDGYTHDTQCVVYNGPDLAHIGREICFSSNEDTITIVDAEDKNNITQISRTSGHPNCTGYSDCYIHQGWLSEDQRYFFINDELDETKTGVNTRTYLWDLQDLEQPVYIGYFESPTPAVDHNLYVKGNFVYQANYRSGLRILDAHKMSTGEITQAGYFDLYPADDIPEYDGAWSVYPYYQSDLVVVSHINEGIFILQPKMANSAEFTIQASEPVVELCEYGKIRTTIQSDSLYGFGAPIEFAVSGLPSNATATFLDNSILPNSSVILEISADQLPTDAFLLSVTATSGQLTAQEFIRLNTNTSNTGPCLGKPTAVTLKNNRIGRASTFYWLLIFLLGLLLFFTFHRRRSL